MYAIMYCVPGRERFGFWLVAAPGGLEERVEKAQAMRGSDGTSLKAMDYKEFQDFASALEHLKAVSEKYNVPLYRPHSNIAAVAFFGDPAHAILRTAMIKVGYEYVDIKSETKE